MFLKYFVFNFGEIISRIGESKSLHYKKDSSLLHSRIIWDKRNASQNKCNHKPIQAIITIKLNRTFVSLNNK